MARSETFHSRPLPFPGVFGADLVDAPVSHARCLPVTSTSRGRGPWKYPAGSGHQDFHQKATATAKPKLLSLPSVLLLLLFTTPKCIKCI